MPLVLEGSHWTYVFSNISFLTGYLFQHPEMECISICLCYLDFISHYLVSLFNSFIAIMNGICFLISQLYRNANDFCALIASCNLNLNWFQLPSFLILPLGFSILYVIRVKTKWAFNFFLSDLDTLFSFFSDCLVDLHQLDISGEWIPLSCPIRDFSSMFAVGFISY